MKSVLCYNFIIFCYNFNNVDYEINYMKGRQGPTGPQGYKGQKGDAYNSATKGNVYNYILNQFSFVMLQQYIVILCFWFTS